MKPLYSINATGNQLFPVIAHLCTKCSEALKDRPFEYKDSITMMEQQAPSLQTQGGIFYSVTMIFEAENQKAIDDLVNDESLKMKQLRPA